MTDFSDFDPLFQRTEEQIRADFNLRANAGLTPDDPEWVDTRPPGSFYIMTQPSVIEFASAYDRMNEIAAASILSTSWGEYLDLHAASFGDERLQATRATGEITFTGVDGTIIGSGTRVSPVQTDPEVEPPIFETTDSGVIAGGTLTLPIHALETGVAGNVDALTITYPRSATPGVVSLTNTTATDGGEEEESDDALKARLKERFKGKGSGTMADYAREALLWPGVGRVTVERHWDGPGTVRLIILDNDGNPLPAQVGPLQVHMDPVPMGGEGWAPINHEVTVATPVLVAIHNSAQVAFKNGYSLDGTDGTVALRGPITRAIEDYENALEPGEDAIYEAVQARIFRVGGVLDIGDVFIGTVDPPVGTANIAITALQVAQAGNTTLTAI